jgi:hypothetical protein
MPRIDMTSRELTGLLKPVIPHASTDPKSALSVIRIDTIGRALFAIATDRASLAAERRFTPDLDWLNLQPQPVHVRLADVKAALKLFPYAKEDDPQLRITIDNVFVPVTTAGRRTSVRRLAITVESETGTRLVLHDQRDPSSDPLAGWRGKLRGALERPMTQMAPALHLEAAELSRWAAACRGAERLAVFTGTTGDDLVLMAVEDHFLGVWAPKRYLESPEVMLADSAWRADLCPQRDLLRDGAGLLTGTELADAMQSGDPHAELHADGAPPTPDVNPALFQQPATTAATEIEGAAK